MPASYLLENLREPISRGGSPKDFILRITRGYATEFEPAGSPVFYFQNEDEAKETLDSLLTR